MTRKVRCQQLLALGEIANKPVGHCSKDKPTIEKKCNTQKCPPGYKPPRSLRYPTIKSKTDQNYVQSSTAVKTIKLKVGGKATVYQGTKLKIRCPVKKVSRYDIQWAKGHQRIKKMDGKRDKRANSINTYVTKRGSLNIRYAEPMDSGLYTCMVQNSKATIDVVVRSMNGSENDLLHHEMNSYNHGMYGGHDSDHEGLKSSYNYEPKQNADNGQLYGVLKHMTDYPTDNTIDSDSRSATTNSFGEEHRFWPTDGPGDRSSNRGKDLEYYDEDDYFYKNEVSNEFWDPFGKSENSEAAAYYLRNKETEVTLQKNKRKERKGFDFDDMPRDEEDQTDTAQNDNISLEWKADEWSKCSQTCGNEGKMYRKVRCAVSTREDYGDGSSSVTAETIPDAICVDAGVTKPQTEASCNNHTPCPRWFALDWPDCDQSKCLSRKTGIVHRQVLCGSDQDQPTDERFCEAVLKPRASKTCRNKQCKGKWKAGQWSECEGGCGQVGQKRREAFCYWKGTNQPAGDDCKKRRRPKIVAKCRMPKCHTRHQIAQEANNTTESPLPIITDILHPNSVLTSVCVDRTKYCGLVQHFQLCHKEKYQTQCCQSCKNS